MKLKCLTPSITQKPVNELNVVTKLTLNHHHHHHQQQQQQQHQQQQQQ